MTGWLRRSRKHCGQRQARPDRRKGIHELVGWQYATKEFLEPGFRQQVSGEAVLEIGVEDFARARNDVVESGGLKACRHAWQRDLAKRGLRFGEHPRYAVDRRNLVRLATNTENQRQCQRR